MEKKDHYQGKHYILKCSPLATPTPVKKVDRPGKKKKRARAQKAKITRRAHLRFLKQIANKGTEAYLPTNDETSDSERYINEIEKAIENIKNFLLRKFSKTIRKIEVFKTPDGTALTILFDEDEKDETIEFILDKAYEKLEEEERKHPEIAGEISIGDAFI